MRKTLLAVMMVGLLATPVHAAIDWEEGFEYASKAAQNAVWTSSCPADTTFMMTTTERVRTGSRALKMEYLGHQSSDGNPPTPGYKSCFMDRQVANGVGSDTLYTRMWFYVTGAGGTGTFTADIVGTKVMYNIQGNAYPNFWWMISKFSNMVLNISMEGVPNAAQTAKITTDVAAGGIPQNQWTCFETRLTISTPGQADGIVQSWINGQLRHNITNQRMRDHTFNRLGGNNGPNTQFKMVRLYIQDGVGVVYVDDFAVSRDARIGCIGPNPGDTTPPSIPGSFTVQ